MKKYRISPRCFRKIIKSYQSAVEFQRGLCNDYMRDSDYYFHLWLEQLKISDNLRKSLKITSIMLIFVSLCLLAVTFFGV